MRSPTCGQAGSMPEATLARGPLALDEEFLADVEISDFQREIAGKLLRIVEAMPPQSVTTRAYIGGIGGLPPSTAVVNFVPRRGVSAEITIYIEPSTSVHIGVAHGTTYSLPHDVWDSRAKDVPRFTEQIVRAVVDGKFRETIYSRGGVPIRWKSELDVEGIPVSMDRKEVLGNLRGVFRKRTKREVVYPPYT
jgi:hypothetical protein